MKLTKPLLILIAASLLMGCGAESPPSTAQTTTLKACRNHAFLGVWTDGTDTLTLYDDCTGYDSYCDSKVLMAETVVQGNLTVTFGPTNGNGACPLPGTYGCAINHAEPTLTVDCGGGAIVYSR